MTDAAPRFTVAGAFAGAVQAVRRAPLALALLLLVDVPLTGSLAWVDAAFLSGNGLGPWIGRLGNSLAFMVIDATLATLVLVVAVDALEGKPADPGDAVRRMGAALPVSLPLAGLTGGVRMLAGMFVYQPISGNEMGFMFAPLVSLAELAMSVLLACTVGLATFAAVTGAPAAAWGRSLRLIRKARWRLVCIALIVWISDLFADGMASALASIAVPGDRPGPLWDAVSQAVYTVWYVSVVLLSAGTGVLLARVEATRDPDQLAETFA